MGVAYTTMKITLMYDFLKEMGGLERVMFFQANNLISENEVELLFSYVSEAQKKKIIGELTLDKRVTIKQIGALRNDIVQYVLSVVFPGRLREKRDLIISHSFMATRMAFLNKRKTGTPYVVYLHHPPNFLYEKDIFAWANNISRKFSLPLRFLIGGRLKKEDRQAVRGADLLIANSKYTAMRAHSIYGVMPHVIYPPVSPVFTIINPARVKAFQRAKKITRPFFLAHGRVIPDKSYHDLIPLMKAFPHYDLYISGTVSEDYKSLLQQEAQTQGVAHRVKILGRISTEDLIGYYNAARLFLTPAHKEDFGITVIEALSCGCPVIAWNDGAGPSEIVGHKDAGLLAKPYDLKNFSETIGKALTMKFTKQKVRKYAQKFSEKNIRKEFLLLLSKIRPSDK